MTTGLGALKPIALESLDSSLSPEDVDDKLLCPVRCLYASSISMYLKQAIAMAHSEIDPNSLKSASIKPRSVRHVFKARHSCHLFVTDMSRGQFALLFRYDCLYDLSFVF